MQNFLIGDIVFSWKDNGENMRLGEFTQRFCITEDQIAADNERIIYRSMVLDEKYYCNGRLLEKNGLYELYETIHGKLLIYHWATCRFAYGYFANQLNKGNVVNCMMNPNLPKEYPLHADRFFSTLGMHGKLLQKGAVVLHASYIDWNGQAILFTAPSQMGKSTQAKLWERCEHAQIVNEDRALLRKKKNIWHAYGYPACGSSSVCLNRTMPVRVIVVLEQGEVNRIETMTVIQKIRALVSGIEVFLWNKMEIEQSLQLASELAEQLPIVRLICRPEENAVEVLRNYLEEM